MRRRIFSTLLALVMVFSLLPATAITAFAAETYNGGTGLSPVGTTINMFDYWFVNKNDSDNESYLIYGNSPVGNLGINNGHQLKFTSDGRTTTNANNEYGTHINLYTNSAKVYSDIVKDQLENGFPVLKAGNPLSTTANDNSTEESLAYLFDPDYKATTGDTTLNYRETYKDVKGLLTVNDGGYFEFDSSKIAASIGTDKTNFALYTTTGTNIGFYPFNSASQAGYGTTDTNASSLNHFFGVHMSTQFVQSENGMRDDDPVTYEFTGDDDVWVFIDGVLVGDLGGIHSAATLKIDFSNGSVTVNEGKTDGNGTSVASTTTIKNEFISAGKATQDGTDGWRGNTFADDTYHTLDFFFLERGGNQSNMMLKFNMEEIPPSYIQKVDQDGRALADVEFSLSLDAANSHPEVTFADAKTDSNGELELYYDDSANTQMGAKAGHLLSLEDIYRTYSTGENNYLQKYGNTDQDVIYLTLKEKSTPEGYRTVGNISLRLQQINNNYVLLSNDIWTKGAYAMSTVATTADQNITLQAGGTKDLQSDGGIMFPIVLKWIGEGTPDANDTGDNRVSNVQNWAPVYGNDTDGWSLEKPNYGTSTEATEINKAFRTAVATAAINILNDSDSKLYTFSASTEGNWKTTIEELPGDITTYYYMQPRDEETNAVTNAENVKYTIAYYYVDASAVSEGKIDVAKLSESTLSQVNSDNFTRDFAVKVNVPNIKNYLVVQRLDEQGNAVEGAKYTLYDSSYADYEVNNDGKLTITKKTGTYNGISETDTTTNRVAGQKNPTSYKEVGQTENTNIDEDNMSEGTTSNPSRFTLNGAAYFSGLTMKAADTPGVYYLVETDPPTGYAANEQIVLVIVDDDGVHAYAGNTAESGTDSDQDGITTMVGVGSLVDSLAQFGSAGEVDQTLTYITASKKTGTYKNGQIEWIGTDNQSDNIPLKYSSEAALQYVYDADPIPAGHNAYGFISASGWTWFNVDQNLKLDSEDNPDKTVYGNANVTNLNTVGNFDLNKLFSGTTTVRFAASGVGDLSITKKVAPDAGQNLTTDQSNKTFTFNVSFTSNASVDENIDLSAATPAGTYDYEVGTEKGTLTISQIGTKAVGDGTETTPVYYITDVSDSTSSHFTQTTVENENDAYALSLKHNETLTISELPVGTEYEVSENTEPGYTSAYQLEINDVAQTLDTGATSVTGEIEEAGDRHEVTVTNTVTPVTYTLTYDANGGNSSPLPAQVIGLTPNQTYTLDSTTTPTHDRVDGNDVVFIGWTETTTNGAVYSKASELPDLVEEVTITGNMTVYAVWAVDAKGGTDENGNDTGDNTPDVYQVFLKFVAGEGGTVTQPEDDTTVPAKSQTITFENSATSGAVSVDPAVTATANKAASETKDTYVFTGWSWSGDDAASSAYTGNSTDSKLENAITGLDDVKGGTTITFTASFEKDNWNADNNEETGGDGTPDKYQVKVVYQADSNGTIADNANTLEILTIKDDQGNLATSGQVEADGSEAAAESGYHFDKWTGTKTVGDETTNLDQVPTNAKTEKITLTGVNGGDVYTYTASFVKDDTTLGVTKTLKSITDSNGTTRNSGDMAQVGDTVTWTITVTNNGNVELQNVEVTDQLTGATFEDPTGQDSSYTLNDAKTVATIGTLSINDPVTLQVTYEVQPTDAGKNIKNIAVATNNDDSSTTGEDDSVTVEQKELTVTKTADKTGSVTAGSTITYTIVVENTGNVKLTNITVKDTMSNNGTVEVVESNAYTVNNDGTVTIDSLNPQGSVDITVSYKTTSADVGKDIYNTAVATTGDTTGTGTSDKTRVTSSGSSGGTKYTLTYVTNGGSAIAPTRHSPNTVVQLTKTPLREGYTFTGWYADEGLTQKITEIKMTSNKTVYAGWELTSVPGLLNSDDHYAYIIGYPDGTVRPNGSITRAEVATIFFRLLTDEARQANLTESNQFTDVNPGQWFNIPISTMAKLGILNGRTATTFAPDEPITRAEFAAICARFDTSLDLGTSQFTDLNGHWAKAEIEKAVSLGWIMGYEDNTFRPDNNITRAEAATMINRVLQRIPETPEDLLTNMQTWPDNADTKKWYYLAIQEATNSHDFQRKTELYETWTQLRETPDWTQYEH